MKTILFYLPILLVRNLERMQLVIHLLHAASNEVTRGAELMNRLI